jgi:capsular polysaccharide biosynthesis protein
MQNIRHLSLSEVFTREWKKALLAFLIVVLLGVVVTLVQPFLYKATVSILVIQKSGFSIDAYSASKSEERVANKLAQVVYSSSFLEKVLSSDSGIDKSYFPSDELKRRKKWGQTVNTDVPLGLSRLDVFIYHTDSAQALKIGQAIGNLLSYNEREFIGIADIDLKLLDNPIVSRYPAKPDIVLNFGASIILGAVLAFLFVVLTYNPEKDKLFENGKNSPHLVRFNEPVKKENTLVKTTKSEISYVEKVADLAPVKEETFKEKIKMPSVSSQFSRESSVSTKPNPVVPVKPVKKIEYPEFKDEGEIKGV